MRSFLRKQIILRLQAPNLHLFSFRSINQLFKVIFCTTSFFCIDAFALPVDVGGSIGIDSHYLRYYRRTEDLRDDSQIKNGSQFIKPAVGRHEHARFQSYILRLRPSIIINDSATFYSEITTGHANGGFLGDSAGQRKEETAGRSFGDALYLQNIGQSQSNLRMSQFYLELYSSLATYTVGRQSAQWGLGVLYNKGEGAWDRFQSLRYGLSANLKIGNLHFNPYYGKINSLNTHTKATHTKEYGISALYDNLERDLAFGILLGRKSSGAENSFYYGGTSQSQLGRTKVKITDIYFKKTFGGFTFATEIPILSGNLGSVYIPGQLTRIKSHAIITESLYKFNDNWSLGLNLGHVNGDDGSQAHFSAMYLHPNYQIGRLMFRYNLLAVENVNGSSIFDSYMVNIRYARLYGTYKAADSWLWSAGILKAVADKPAKIGTAYDHLRNKNYSSIKNQDKNLGTEINAGFQYLWNNNVSLFGDFAYHFVGDYFAYANTQQDINVKNTYALIFGISSQF